MSASFVPPDLPLRLACRVACLRGAVLAHVRFDLAHAQALVDDFLRDPFGIGLAEQQTRVAGGNFARAHQLLHGLGQLEQSNRVRDMRPALADDLRDLVLAVRLKSSISA